MRCSQSGEKGGKANSLLKASDWLKKKTIVGTQGTRDYLPLYAHNFWLFIQTNGHFWRWPLCDQSSPSVPCVKTVQRSAQN